MTTLQLVSAMPGDPNNPKNTLQKLLQQIKKSAKETDIYLVSYKDPLQTTWLKYIGNINIIGITAQKLLPQPIRTILYLTSVAHVGVSTYYQQQRTNMYPGLYINKPKQTEIITYGSMYAIKNLIIYPVIMVSITKLPVVGSFVLPLGIGAVLLIDDLLIKLMEISLKKIE